MGTKTEDVERIRDELAMVALTHFLGRPIVAADRRAAIKNMGRDAYAVANAMMKASALLSGKASA